ncbi:unnamed protein product, partial [Phaeothamnion confervicola]
PQLPSTTTPLAVPVSPVAQMTYKKFHISDILYSKVGIALLTSTATFVSLVIINPPFIHETVDDDIRCPKPNYLLAYILSVVSFMVMMLVPVGTSRTKM